MSNQTEKQALKNIFEDKSVKTIYGTIIERITSRKFKVFDDIERTIIVNADREWSLGAYVVVQNGIITGTGRRSGSYKVYRV